LRYPAHAPIDTALGSPTVLSLARFGGLVVALVVAPAAVAADELARSIDDRTAATEPATPPDEPAPLIGTGAPEARAGEPCEARRDCADGLPCYARVCRGHDSSVVTAHAPRRQEAAGMTSPPRAIFGGVLSGLGAIQLAVGGALLAVASGSGSFDSLGEAIAGTALLGNGALMTAVGLPLIVSGVLPSRSVPTTSVRFEPTPTGIHLSF